MKHRLQTAVLLAAMALTLALSDRAAEAVRQGLELCARSVIPALFPFLVLSGVLTATGIGISKESKLSGLMQRLFGCTAGGITAFVLGILGGYPLGARTAERLYAAGHISREEGENLLTFCNNAGPAFIITLVGRGCFESGRIGIWLYLIHVAAATLTGLMMSGKTYLPPASPAAEPPPPQPFAQALVSAIAAAGSAMVQICAYVTFALTALQLFTQLTGITHPLLLGGIELTNGILRLQNQRRDFLFAAALLGWGGLSVHGQTAAVTAQLHPDMGRYLRAKLLHAIISVLLALPAAQLLFCA